MLILLLQLTQTSFIRSIEVRLFDRYGEAMPTPAPTLISNKNVLGLEYVNAYIITSINTDAFHSARSHFPHASGDFHRRETNAFC